MPDTLTGWALFAFYTLGSAGGIGFIGLFLVEVVGAKMAERRRMGR